MLILSKHHDYYDGVVHAGIDKTIVYKRLIRTFHQKVLPTLRSEDLPTKFVEVKTEPYKPSVVLPNGTEFELDVGGLKFPRFNSFNVNTAILTRGVILFCGKVYPYCKVRVPLETNDFLGQKWETFYENASANSAILTAYKFVVDKELERGYELERIRRMVKDFDHSKRVLPLGDRWSKNVILDLHRAVASPIIHVTNIIETNVNLKDLQFQRMVDPYTAFQEISMFIGGVLGSPEKEVTELTEKDRIQQHGFNKWSFRKLPHKDAT